MKYFVSVCLCVMILFSGTLQAKNRTYWSISKDRIPYVSSLTNENKIFYDGEFIFVGETDKCSSDYVDEKYVNGKKILFNVLCIQGVSVAKVKNISDKKFLLEQFKTKLYVLIDSSKFTTSNFIRVYEFVKL